MKLSFLLSLILGAASQCVDNLHLDLAILLDAGGSEEHFENQRKFTRKLLEWLPESIVGNQLRVSLVPYSWGMSSPYKPTNGLNENKSKDRFYFFFDFSNSLFCKNLI